MNIVEQYQFDKVKCKNLMLDIDTYENDYLNLGDTDEKLNKLTKLKSDYENKCNFISAFEKALPSLSKEEHLFIKYVYKEHKKYNEFAYDLFNIDLKGGRMNSFCGMYKMYVLMKLKRETNKYLGGDLNE